MNAAPAEAGAVLMRFAGRKQALMSEASPPGGARPCLRCQQPMENLGWRHLEGAWLSNAIEVRMHKCRACGYLEFSTESDGERKAREAEEERAARERKLKRFF